jgi:hypothetical protein
MLGIGGRRFRASVRQNMHPFYTGTSAEALNDVPHDSLRGRLFGGYVEATAMRKAIGTPCHRCSMRTFSTWPNRSLTERPITFRISVTARV